MFSDHLHGDFLPDENFGSASRHPARQVVCNCHDKLGKASEKHYMDYIERKVTAWYAKFPPKHDDPAAAAAEEAASERAPVEAGGQSAAVEDEAEGLEMSDVE